MAGTNKNKSKVTIGPAVFDSLWTVVSFDLANAGTGYAVGDRVRLIWSLGSFNAVFGVITVGAGGAVEDMTILTGGVYNGNIEFTQPCKTLTGHGTGLQIVPHTANLRR